ncbi:MAG: flagellar hook-length control protein FliK, partial [Nocardioides sp.]
DPTAVVAPTAAPALVVLPPALLQAVVAAASGSAPAATLAEAAATHATAGVTPPSAASGAKDDAGKAEPAPVSGAPVAPGPTSGPDTPVAPVTTAQPAPTATPDPAPSGTPGVQAVAPLTSAPAPVGITPTPPAPASRVTHQVFPEVLRVAGLGDGPKRVTVRLQPESLGEVRVVLTSRRGELQVSLAATGDAHRALLEGAPELRRLLEVIGNPDARVTVRDLPGSTGTAPAAPATGSGLLGSDARDGLAGGGAGSGTGTGGSAGQTASDPQGRRTPRGSSTAMDGVPGATDPSRRTESVTRARTGLDVTV